MKGYLKTGMSLIGPTVIVGSIPNITGSATETNLKGKFAEGMSETGKVLPVYGKIKGVEMTLKPLSMLKEKGKKVVKGGYNL